jgi:hypothetical protein
LLPIAFARDGLSAIASCPREDPGVKHYSMELAFTDNRDIDLPVGPIAEICVRGPDRRNKEGPPALTHSCMSMAELDSEINRLKGELDGIRKKASAKFASWTQRGTGGG